MKSTINILTMVILGFLIIPGCTKVADLPYYSNGTAPDLGVSPSVVIAPAAADSNKTVLTLKWSDPKYATDSSHVKFIIEIDSAGRNFAKATTKTVTKTLTSSFTGRELNTILLNYGYALGKAVKLDLRVTSSYSNNNDRKSSNVVQLTVTPYGDPAKLITEKTSVSGSLATGSQHSNTFTWSPAFPGYSGTVTYVIEYDSAGKNFVSPQQIPNVGGAAVYSASLTQSDMNNTAINSGIPMNNQSGKVEYRVKATTAAGAVAYSNVVNVTIQTYVPLLRFYVPGGYQGATGNGNDWDPATAPELVRDLRTPVYNKLYYAYMYFPAGAEFKITQGRSWDVNYGGTGGDLAQNGSNFSVTTAGVYRISFDLANMKYDIRPGRMGFVGGATGAGWNPPNVFPNYAMGAPSNNLFVGLTDFTTDAWKMIDNDSWNDGSNTVTETRSYGSNGGDGSTMEVNGPNFPNITTAGRYRAIWDGRDADNIKYFISPATEMRLVGDGIDQAGVNDWDPPSSPQMTYSGNGVWTITIALKANKDIKFLAGNAWGAFDYEDNSGQSQATGVAKKIKWEGGDNFKTPTVAGTYTITLDEKAQTVTIN
jgi:starch-binding outer membrane protein SusE/F